MDTTVAKFRFQGFTVRKSSFEIKDSYNLAPEMDLKLELKGEFIPAECHFILYMKVSVKNENTTVKATADTVAHFEFDRECKAEELPGYFFINAPAILFPYVRAYIATLSTLSGLPNPIMIPTLNLTKFAKQLENNTVEK